MVTLHYGGHSRDDAHPQMPKSRNEMDQQRRERERGERREEREMEGKRERKEKCHPQAVRRTPHGGRDIQLRKEEAKSLRGREGRSEAEFVNAESE